MMRKFFKIIIFTGLILLIPLIAMQFTDEVNWGVMDFVVAGVLLFGTGLILLLIFQKIENKRFRIAAAVAVCAVLVLIWAQLAVGFQG